MRRLLATALVLAGTNGLLGCAPSGRAGPPTDAAAPSSSAPSRVTITIRDYAYDPQRITVPVGTTVTWVQADRTIHTVTDTGTFDSGPLSRGQRYSFTFHATGTYDYLCSVHPSMKGSVTVQ